MQEAANRRSMRRTTKETRNLPRCGAQFLNGEEVSGFNKGHLWPDYGSPGDTPDGRWPGY